MSDSARVTRCELPPGSRLLEALAPVDYLESFAVDADAHDRTIVEIYAALLGRPPAIFKHALVLRSLIVKPLGLRGVRYRDLDRAIDTTRTYAPGDRLGRWTIYAHTADELVTGEDDAHLNFRVSVLRDPGAKRIVLSTSVQTRNALGRAYLATILPAHRLGVGFLLRRGMA